MGRTASNLDATDIPNVQARLCGGQPFAYQGTDLGSLGAAAHSVEDPEVQVALTADHHHPVRHVKRAHQSCGDAHVAQSEEALAEHHPAHLVEERTFRLFRAAG